MASKRPSGLGKGLGALLGDDVMKTESSGSLSLPISQVESYSGQPRKHFDEESLQAPHRAEAVLWLLSNHCW